MILCDPEKIVKQYLKMKKEHKCCYRRQCHFKVKLDNGNQTDILRYSTYHQCGSELSMRNNRLLGKGTAPVV